MREILFRGKTPGGEWKLGYLNQHRGIDEYDSNYEKIRSCDFYIFDYAEKIGSGLYGCVYKVLPETVGQYTGLNDRRSIRIFENDIVRFGQNIYVIKSYWGGYCLYDETGEMIVKIGGMNKYYYPLSLLHDECCWAGDMAADIEVIGNIFDNPELIGGDAKCTL